MHRGRKPPKAESLAQASPSVLASGPAMRWQMCHRRETRLWVFSPERSTDESLLPRESDILADEAGLKSGGKMGPSHLEAGPEVGGSTCGWLSTRDSEHLPANALPRSICALSPAWWSICTRRTERALPMHSSLLKKKNNKKLKPEEGKTPLEAFGFWEGVRSRSRRERRPRRPIRLRDCGVRGRIICAGPAGPSQPGAPATPLRRPALPTQHPDTLSPEGWREGKPVGSDSQAMRGDDTHTHTK